MNAIKLIAGREDHGATFELMDLENEHVGAIIRFSDLRISGKYQEFDATYMHFASPPDRPPTEAEAATLAKFWRVSSDQKHTMLRLNSVLRGIFRSGPNLGADICKWAFGEMSPDEVSKKYGDGKRVYLQG